MGVTKLSEQTLPCGRLGSESACFLDHRRSTSTTSTFNVFGLAWLCFKESPIRPDRHPLRKLLCSVAILMLSTGCIVDLNHFETHRRGLDEFVVSCLLQEGHSLLRRACRSGCDVWHFGEEVPPRGCARRIPPAIVAVLRESGRFDIRSDWRGTGPVETPIIPWGSMPRVYNCEAVQAARPRTTFTSSTKKLRLAVR